MSGSQQGHWLNGLNIKHEVKPNGVEPYPDQTPPSKNVAERSVLAFAVKRIFTFVWVLLAGSLLLGLVGGLVGLLSGGAQGAWAGLTIALMLALLAAITAAAGINGYGDSQS